MKANIKETLDRKIPPPVHEVTNLFLPYPSVFYLDNGIPVYETRLGTQEIMKVEIVFMSGRLHEHKRLVSRATARMLREGTASYTSAVLAERVDFYAGTLQTPVSLDTGSLVMYCMNKHFPKLVPILAEMLLEPTFPEKELKTYIDNNIQTLLVDLSKNDVLAYRHITELIFGENHPYGYNSTPVDYRALTQADLLKHHAEQLTSDNCLIFLSGKTNDTILALLNQYIGQKKTVAQMPKQSWDFPIQKPQSIKIKHEDTLQAAIRIGRRFGTRKHPDFAQFYVLNTILGGYFSSRLMTNIREKRGFTYNIYSALDLMHHDGYFYISSEIGNKFVKKALVEIYHEMEKLQHELVSDHELKMVKNYLLGNMLNMIDGPFAVSEVVKAHITEGVDFNHFHQFIDTVRHITPLQIRNMAQKYFNKADMFEVIVGV